MEGMLRRDKEEGCYTNKPITRSACLPNREIHYSSLADSKRDHLGLFTL